MPPFEIDNKEVIMVGVSHTFHQSVERTGTGLYVVVGIEALPCGSSKEGTFFLDVTAIEAATTLDCKIQTQDPISLKWFDVVAFTQASGVTTEKKVVIDNLGNKIRATYLITNSKKSTFTCSCVVKG